LKPPVRGEVWIVDLGLAAKVRPAVVLSVPPRETERALVTLVPHTTSLRGSRFEVATRVPFLKEGAFDAQGLVTVPFARLVRPIGQLKPHELAGVERAVRSWLGFPGPRVRDNNAADDAWQAGASPLISVSCGPTTRLQTSANIGGAKE
jgi:mRNA interferase MazF